MKKQLRVLGVLVCLLPLMTGCLSQTKDKQGSSSSHKTSQTTKKKASSSFSGGGHEETIQALSDHWQELRSQQQDAPAQGGMELA